MGKPKRYESALLRAASLFDLPADAVAGVPRVELLGENELRVENHRGILSYSTEEIHISTGHFIIQVQGQTLSLRAMTAVDLLITGTISGLSIQS